MFAQGEDSIAIDWGSSDGFTSHKTFLREMKKKYPNYVHFFDPEHIVKNMRNHLLKPVKREGREFSLRVLCDLRNSSEEGCVSLSSFSIGNF